MQFIRSNIAKTFRNGSLNTTNTTSNIGSTTLSGNFLPAINNGDGTYTVNIDKVLFSGNVIAEGQVSAYGVAEESGEGGMINIDIIDNLQSVRTDAALSANQGRILKDLIDTKTSVSSWEDITDKPTTFPPSIHTHEIADITNLQTNLDNKAALKHTHTKTDITDFPTGWAWANITGKPTTVKGYGITDAVTINDEQIIKSSKKWTTDASDLFVGYNDNGTPAIKHIIHTSVGWARGYGFYDSEDNPICSFGGYGYGDTLLYQYVGNDYQNPWQKWNSTRSDLNVPLYINNSIVITDSNFTFDNLNNKPALLTETNIEKWNAQTHTHNNKTVLDSITSGLTTNWNAAYTHISDTTKHITSTERTNWNKAYTNNHTHSNKSVLDTITSTKTNNWDKVYTDFNSVFEIDGDNLKVKLNLVGEKQVSAYGAAEEGEGTGTTIDIIDNLLSTRKDAALSANQGRILKSLIDSKVSTVTWDDIQNKPSTFTPASHTHNYVSTIKLGNTSYTVSGNTISLPAYPTVPTSLKNPYGLTISLNGTSQGAYDGSAAKSINITAASVGAAASSHTHTKSQITDFPTTWSWGSITGKPSTLSGYGITANDVLNTLKTVDGSGSGLNSDTLDGYNSTSFESYKLVEIDASSLDNNTWYPVTMSIGNSLQTRIRIEGRTSANASWNTRADKEMALILDYTVNGSYWGWTNVSRIVYQYIEGQGTSSCLGGLGQLTNSSTEYIFVRGGAKYNFYVSRFITPVLRTSTYTVSSQSISPTTSKPATITVNNALKSSTVAAADKLTVNAGSNTNPIFFQNGIPVASSYSVGNNTGNIAVNNGVLCTNLNADKLDGVDKTGLLTALSSNSTTNLSITVGGTTKNITNLYAEYWEGSTTYNPIITIGSWSRILTINGYSSILLSIQFDATNQANQYVCYVGTGYLYANMYQLGGNGYTTNGEQIRITRTNNTTFNVEIKSDYIYNGASTQTIKCRITKLSPSTSYTTYTSATAGGGTAVTTFTLNSKTLMNAVVESSTKLQTERTIWGQKFNGTANVSGDLTNVGKITFSDTDSLLQTTSQSFNFMTSSGTAKGIKVKSLLVGDGYSSSVDTGCITASGDITAKKLNVKGSANSTGYINADTSYNMFFNVGGISLLSLDSSTKTVRAGASENGNVNLGNSTTRWSNLYSVAGNFSGNITASGGINYNGSEITNVNRITFATGDAGRKTVITNGGSFLLYTATGGWAGGLGYYTNDGSNSLGNAAGAYGSGNILNYYFYGGTYNSPIMTINPSTKYVGIGTTAATQKLHVVGNILATGAITAQAASDARLKDIVKTKKTYQQRLLELGNIVDFTYNTTAKERNKNAVDDKKHIGLIYQNAVKSELNNFCFKDEKDGYGSINYLSTDYINLIAGALQESIKEIKKLKREINKLKQAQNEENNKMVS